MSIQVKALSKRIDNREILRGITFTWQPGRIVGLVGRNGVGKTRQKLFYIDTQRHFFGGQRLRQIITTYALAYDDFDQSQLTALLAAEHLSTKSYYQRLSKGQQMLFQILLALASHVPYIILDEPFDGLDIIVRERIVAYMVEEVAEHGVSFLISSHNLDELDGLCDQVLFMERLRIREKTDELYDMPSTAQHFTLLPKVRV